MGINGDAPGGASEELDHDEEEGSQADERGKGEGHGVGLKQARGIGEVAGDAADDAKQGGEHQDVASGIPAADFELVVIGDGGGV